MRTKSRSYVSCISNNPRYVARDPSACRFSARHDLAAGDVTGAAIFFTQKSLRVSWPGDLRSDRAGGIKSEHYLRRTATLPPRVCDRDCCGGRVIRFGRRNHHVTEKTWLPVATMPHRLVSFTNRDQALEHFSNRGHTRARLRGKRESGIGVRTRRDHSDLQVILARPRSGRQLSARERPPSAAEDARGDTSVAEAATRRVGAISSLAADGSQKIAESLSREETRREWGVSFVSFARN